MRERTRALDQALELSRAQALRLSEASQSKSDFLNGLGHELRTPLNAIGGYAQLSYAFNYLGPTGNQRDLTATIRRSTSSSTRVGAGGSASTCTTVAPSLLSPLMTR